MPTLLTGPQTDFLKALLSGDIDQAQHVLRSARPDGDRPKMCCLGVACDAYGKANGIEWEVIPGIMSDDLSRYAFLNSGLDMPTSVRVWLGLLPEEGNPILWTQVRDSGNTAPRSATYCNDCSELPFVTIAFLFHHLFTEGDEFEGSRAQLDDAAGQFLIDRTRLGL